MSDTVWSLKYGNISYYQRSMVNETESQSNLGDVFDEKLELYRSTLNDTEYPDASEYEISMNFLQFMVNTFGSKVTGEDTDKYAQIDEEELVYYKSNPTYPALVIIADNLHLLLFNLENAGSIKQAIFNTLEEIKSTTRFHVLAEGEHYKEFVPLGDSLINELSFIQQSLKRMYGDLQI